MEQKSERFPWWKAAVVAVPIFLGGGLQCANEFGYVSDPVTLVRRAYDAVFPPPSSLERYARKVLRLTETQKPDVVSLRDVKDQYGETKTVFELKYGDVTVTKVEREDTIFVHIPLEDGLENKGDGLESRHGIGICRGGKAVQGGEAGAGKFC